MSRAAGAHPKVSDPIPTRRSDEHDDTDTDASTAEGDVVVAEILRQLETYRVRLNAAVSQLGDVVAEPSLHAVDSWPRLARKLVRALDLSIGATEATIDSLVALTLDETELHATPDADRAQ